MKMIVGLGNPGKKYEQTKHNVGFMVVDQIANQENSVFKKTAFEAEVADFFSNGEKKTHKLKKNKLTQSF